MQVWEDIVEVNPRMVLVLIASVMALDTQQPDGSSSPLKAQRSFLQS